MLETLFAAGGIAVIDGDYEVALKVLEIRIRVRARSLIRASAQTDIAARPARSFPVNSKNLATVPNATRKWERTQFVGTWSVVGRSSLDVDVERGARDDELSLVENLVDHEKGRGNQRGMGSTAMKGALFIRYPRTNKKQGKAKVRRHS
jgi:hypothetical protein